MKLEISEKDKKLLVFLAVFLVFFGLLFGVIRPLFSSNQEIKTNLENAKIEQMEIQRKVSSLVVVQKNNETANATLSEEKAKYFSIMTSNEIDKLLTEMALDRNIMVNDLNINLPKLQEYTTLTSYLVNEKEEGKTDLTNIYTANVSLSLSGTRTNLWDMLDALQAMEPKVRVTELLWQTNRNSATTLSFTFEMYMVDDTSLVVVSE